jgi:hypothetical protein
MRLLVGWWLDTYFLVRTTLQEWGKAIDRAMDWEE